MNDPFALLLEPTEKKSTHLASVGLVFSSGRYRLGPAARPNIRHDNGHLDLYPKREPMASDRAQLAKWTAILEGAEAICNAQTGKYFSACGKDDLADANAAYRHFLFGKGKDRTINYERYLQGDKSAVNLITNVFNDFQKHIEIIGKDRVKFSVTSEPYTVGRGGIAEYPSTANWQKTLGAHFLWVSADVTVAADSKGDIYYEANVTIHVEDRYNFNPGAQDVATGIPDSANGQLEITGLATQYTNFATVARRIRWKEGAPRTSKTSTGPSERQRMPANNRRLRNRV